MTYQKPNDAQMSVATLHMKNRDSQCLVVSVQVSLDTRTSMNEKKWERNESLSCSGH